MKVFEDTAPILPVYLLQNKVLKRMRPLRKMGALPVNLFKLFLHLIIKMLFFSGPKTNLFFPH